MMPFLQPPTSPSAPDAPEHESHIKRNAVLLALAGLAGVAASRGRLNPDALLGAGTGLARGYGAYLQGQREEEDRQRRIAQQDEDRTYQRGERQRNEVMDRLRILGAGGVPASQAHDTTLTLPNPMAGSVGGSVLERLADLKATVPAAGRFTPVGGGYALDTWGTSDAMARGLRMAEQMRTDRERSRRVSAMTVLSRRRKDGLSPEEIEAMADDDVTYRQYLSDARKPDPLEAFKARRDYTVAHPMPSRSHGTTPRAADPTIRGRRALTTVEKQIADAERQLAALDKQLKDPSVNPDYADDAVTARSEQARLKRERQQLVTRRDSLNTVRDRLAASMTGTAHPAADVPTDAPEHATGDVSFQEDDREAMQAEYDDAAARYKRLLARGVDPKRAQEAYNATVAGIARKYGAVR